MDWLLPGLAFVDAHNGAFTAIASIAMAGFTAVLMVVTIRQTRLTQNTISLARKEFEAEHRPWITVRDLCVSGSIFIGNDVGVPVEIKLENVGSAPALGFFAYFNIFPFDRASGSQIDRALEDHREQFVRERNTPILGDRLPFGVVFPKDKLLHNETVLVGIEELRGTGSRFNEINLNTIIVGTIFYNSPHAAREHYTTCTYKIRILRKDNRVKLNEFGDYDDVPSERIETCKLHLGWTAT